MKTLENKYLIAIAKEILTNKKTTELYEMFSILSGENNWNIAKSKDINS